MNINTIEHIINEQNSNTNTPKMKIPIHEQDTIEICNKVKRSPMIPTPLYVFVLLFIDHNLKSFFVREYSWWSTHTTAAVLIIIVVLTTIGILVGVLTVCLTLPKPKSM